MSLAYREKAERKENGRGEERSIPIFSYFLFLLLFLNSALAAFEAFADR